MASAHFRAGVVIVVRHPDHDRVLAFERTDSPGAWQLPQGGLNAGEAPIDGAWRELFEETGLNERDVVVRSEHPEWLAYEWPDEVRRDRGREGKRLGQVQRWFLFDALRADVEPSPDGSEFVAWKWVTPRWLVAHVPQWRRSPYERVLSSL
jgi:putative (di)nucleoside polyphosphate hydrolase